MAFKKIPLPFMTAVGGHVLIHAPDTGNPLPDDWRGICEDGNDTTKHWYVGRDVTGRTFRMLKAGEMTAMRLEAATYRAQDEASFVHVKQMKDMANLIASQWDECMYEGVGGDIDIGQAIRETGLKFVESVYPLAPGKPAPEFFEDPELRAYADKVLDSVEMTRALMEAYSTGEISKRPEEGLMDYLRRCVANDFEAGADGCLFPQTYRWATGEAEAVERPRG